MHFHVPYLIHENCISSVRIVTSHADIEIFLKFDYTFYDQGTALIETYIYFSLII